MAAAAAAELVQIGSLVHDDILDVAATRRGRPTINACEGLDHALLAGDYILARAAELAASVSQEAAALVASALAELCEGQVLELRDAFDAGPHASTPTWPRSGARRRRCSNVRASSAPTPPGCRSHNATAVARFGAAFGMSFQVLDDVLDLIGDAERLGKPTGIDIAAGVYTLPVITALRGPRGRPSSAACSRSHPAIMPRPAAPATSPTALEVVRGSGSIAAALATMDRYADEARRAVAHLNQATVGEGLWAFPRTYSTWALETLMDRRYLEVPLTADARA